MRVDPRAFVWRLVDEKNCSADSDAGRQCVRRVRPAFAWAHARNPDVSGVGLANIGLASLLLAAAFFARGGLGTAVGLHLGWNAGLVFGADAPVSGLRFGLPGLEYAPGPRMWWTGGSFGPEGGVAATFVLGAALAWWVRGAALVGVQREREVVA